MFTVVPQEGNVWQCYDFQMYADLCKCSHIHESWHFGLVLHHAGSEYRGGMKANLGLILIMDSSA